MTSLYNNKRLKVNNENYVFASSPIFNPDRIPDFLLNTNNDKNKDTNNDKNNDTNKDTNKDKNNNNKNPIKRNNKRKNKSDEKLSEDDEIKLLLTLMNCFPPQPTLERESKDDTATTTSKICPNPLCDHEDYTEDEKLDLDLHSNYFTLQNSNIRQINNIDDLIEMGKLYHCKKNTEYNTISLRILCNLILPLSELRNMVGMHSVKQNIVNQIIFFLQGFNKKSSCNKCMDCLFNLPCNNSSNYEMLHTVITGPPGVGKTALGKILGKVYKEMEILTKGHVEIVSRSDLIAGYLGQTAIKTQKVIDKAKGGVLFIDEAYSLGSAEGRDSFSKECIDTLNQNLSEKRDFLCIIAGYQDKLDTCLFAQNPGLARRFTFRYNIDGYSPFELKDIFITKIVQDGWNIDCDLNLLNDFFYTNAKYFPNFGGDCETFFLNCKIHHSKRVIFDTPSNKKRINIDDIMNGFNTFVGARRYKDEEKKEEPEMPISTQMMYM